MLDIALCRLHSVVFNVTSALYTGDHTLCHENNNSIPESFQKSTSFLHNYATKSPLVTMGRSKFTPNFPSLRRSPPPSNTPVPRPIPLTIPTASGSYQPFCHSTGRQTDRQTDRRTDRPIDGLGDRSVRLRSLY